MGAANPMDKVNYACRMMYLATYKAQGLVQQWQQSASILPLHVSRALYVVLQVHFFKDFDSSDKFRITGRHENSMLPSHFQVPSQAQIVLLLSMLCCRAVV